MGFKLPENYGVFTDRERELAFLIFDQRWAQYHQEPIGLSTQLDSVIWPFSDVSCVEVSGFESEYFKHELHPVVGGYNWYRVIKVAHRDNPDDQVLIFVPWLTHGTKSSYMVITIGNPPEEWVTQIVDDYIWMQHEAMGLES